MRIFIGIGRVTARGPGLGRMLLGGCLAVALAATVSFAVTGDPEQALVNGVSTVGGMATDRRYAAELRCGGKAIDLQVFALTEDMARGQVQSDYPDCRVRTIKLKPSRPHSSLYD